MTSAWYYRPLADTSNSKHGNYSYNKSSNDDNHSSNSKLKSTLHVGQQKQKPPILSTDSTTATASSTSYNNDDRRTKEFFCAPYTSPPWCREHVPLLLNWARRISIGVTTIAIRILMNTYGHYEIKDDEYYHDFLDAVLNKVDESSTEEEEEINDDEGSSSNNDGATTKVKSKGRRRKHNQGLITVSNHRSLFDDPGIVSCLLPLPKAIQPQYNRWALCSQEYCFNDALPGIIKGYLGAGQVLPICRGAGINQKLLLDFGRHLACGEWCHVFPEGGVWQWDELGGRRELPPNSTIASSSDFGGATGGGASNDDDTIQKIIPATTQQRKLGQSSLGKLKWGVGKLIAHAPITPKVIPFAHVGMEKLLPQDETTGKTKLRNDILSSLLPSILLGGRNTNDDDDKLQVKVQFGKEITFDDLIHEHESKYGKLWKYSGREHNNPSSDEETDKEEYNQKQKQGLMIWKSSYEERVLYSKIVRRIECRLDVLTKQVCQKE